MDIAIITGASSGLGTEFARQIDRNERLDAIWGIARREDRLEEIGRELKHPFRAMRCDLTKKESFVQIDELLKKENPNVKILVNAAGFGKIGAWSDISLQDCEDMIDLNCKAAVKMTQLVLPYMEKGGRILEIASTAGFQSFPYLNVYASTKAFLYRYSRALRVELFGRGIHVTAVCPYWVKDTEFIGVSKQTNNSRYICHFPLASRKKNVVAGALFAAKVGLPVATPGIVCTLHRIAAKFIPNEIMMGLWALLRRI